MELKCNYVLDLQRRIENYDKKNEFFTKEQLQEALAMTLEAIKNISLREVDLLFYLKETQKTHSFLVIARQYYEAQCNVYALAHNLDIEESSTTQASSDALNAYYEPEEQNATSITKSL